MKRTLIVLCAAFTFSFVGYVGAQSDQYGGQSTTSSKSSHAKSSRQVTLTGCLEQGASPNLYVLRNAMEGGQSSSSMSSSSASGSSSSSSSTGTTGSVEQNQQGTSGQSSMQSGQAMDFQLVGKNLKKYVGQRVEITGVVEPMKENSSGAQPQGTTGSATGSTSGTMSGTQSGSTSGQSGTMSGQSGSMSGQTTAGPITHRVKVRSVKELGSSCQ